MSAAILQGVPATMLDTDFWLDLPVRARQHSCHLLSVESCDEE